MFRGDDASGTSTRTSAGQHRASFGGHTSALGLRRYILMLTGTSGITLVSLFNNAENTNISSSQISAQIHVQGHTGL